MTDGAPAVYLLDIRCESCGEESTIPAEGEWVGMMQEAPHPDAECCPRCGDPLPDDLGEILVEDRVAYPLSDPESWYARYSGFRIPLGTTAIGEGTHATLTVLEGEAKADADIRVRGTEPGRYELCRLEDVEHDPDGEWRAWCSDGDMVQHDDLRALFAMAEEFLDARDFLMGNGNVALTIGPADAIEQPSVDSHLEDSA